MGRWDWHALHAAGGLPPPPSRPDRSTGKGVTARRRATKARASGKAEKRIREEVRALDGSRCRVPDCDIPPDSYWGAIEVAHYKAAGMGGDPELDRYTRENLICICRWHHVGPHGLHSGKFQMRPLDPVRGMRGLVEFRKRERGKGRWYSVGVTEPPRHAA